MKALKATFVLGNREIEVELPPLVLEDEGIIDAAFLEQLKRDLLLVGHGIKGLLQTGSPAEAVLLARSLMDALDEIQPHLDAALAALPGLFKGAQDA